MRFISLAAALMLSSGVANAALLDGLRELRGTLGEVTQTNREVGELGRQVTPEKTPESQRQQSQSVSGSLQSGDVLVSKIASVKVYSEANKKSAKLMQLSKSDELIYMGEELNGLYRVTAPDGEGWVDKLLVKKH